MAHFPRVSPYAAGLGTKCPRCGQGKLFDGFLRLCPSCEACGLDYSKADSGDGPAVFVIFIVGFVGVVVAIVARYVFYASIPVAFVISAGISIALILGLLRPLKATMIALQFQHKAAEGKLE